MMYHDKALKKLKEHQQQADTDGVFVTVSRQALDEVLSDFERLLDKLDALESELRHLKKQ